VPLSRPFGFQAYSSNGVVFGVSLVSVLLEQNNLDRRKMTGGRCFGNLFNLGDDLGEQSQLADKFPDRTKSMAEAIADWLHDVGGSATEQPPTQESAGDGRAVAKLSRSSHSV